MRGLLATSLGFNCAAGAAGFHLPTPNRALWERGAEEKYFAGTTGKPWTSGTFGCVRSGGGQMHEGIDIKCVARRLAAG